MPWKQWNCSVVVIFSVISIWRAKLFTFLRLETFLATMFKRIVLRLFLELDRFAFSESTNGHTRGGSSVLEYHPCILTGNFNMTPDSPVYNFLQSGQLNYDGLTRLLYFGFGKLSTIFFFPHSSVSPTDVRYFIFVENWTIF